MEKINKKAVGARIRAIRLANGMTLREFGKLFETSASIALRWETGFNVPKADRLLLIAKFANTTIPNLLYGETENNKRYMYVITYSNYSGPIVQTDTYARVYTSLEAAKRDVARYEQGVPVDQDHRFSIEKMEVVE